MAGHSRSKNASSERYVPAISQHLPRSGSHRKSGLPDFRIGRVHKRINPTCGVKPGDDSGHAMSPDLYFALTLIVKMAITAGFVLAATVTAERAGPLVGGLVATLPIGAGPVYVFLSLDHDAQFIAQSAVASLAINAVNVVFATGLCAAGAKRSLRRQPVGRLGGVDRAGADHSLGAVDACSRRSP